MQEEEKQNHSAGTPPEQPKKHKKEKGKSLLNGLSPCETIFDLRNVLLLHCKNRSICHGKFLLVTVSNKYPPCHRTGGQRIAEQSF